MTNGWGEVNTINFESKLAGKRRVQKNDKKKTARQNGWVQQDDKLFLKKNLSKNQFGHPRPKTSEMMSDH